MTDPIDSLMQRIERDMGSKRPDDAVHDACRIIRYLRSSGCNVSIRCVHGTMQPVFTPTCPYAENALRGWEHHIRLYRDVMVWVLSHESSEGMN